MFSSMIRVSSYVAKEIFELLRQPRLILGLILAPFAILFLVGIGFRDQPRDFRTVFVAPNDPDIRNFVEAEARQVSTQLIYEGVTEDLDEALARLRRGELDLVISLEDDPQERLEEGDRSLVVFYHNSIRPEHSSYMPFFARFAVSEMNRRAVVNLVEEEQRNTQTAKSGLESAVASARALEQATGPRTSGSVLHEQANELADMRRELELLQSQMERFQTLSSDLLVTPFRAQARNIGDFIPSMTDFFVGPVIALLLQHLAITFAGLSFVRDRQLGITELVRVSPMKPIEVLFGKYISHFLLAGLIAAALSVLAITVLEAPMLGDWRDYAVAVASLIFASIGIGSVISLLSETDSHAVQYTMMILLASIFFTGFFFALEVLWWPVRSVAWALPATYGIMMLHDVMLRGLAVGPVPLLMLTGMGSALLLLALILLRRQLRAGKVM